MLRSREDAEDAVQTTFMQAFRALQRGVVPTFETAWLLTIAKNVCLARHRAGSRRKAVEFARDPHDLAEFAASRETNGSLLGLQDALGRLPEMQRRAFLLREWQGRSYAEIAGELGVTVSAVEALIFRARRALARDLGGDTKRRGHAFDLASLAGALKSLLGGGAAVKVAVGAAAVVSAGAVVGGAIQRSDAPSQEPARVEQAPVVASEAPGPGTSLPTSSIEPTRAVGAQTTPRTGNRPSVLDAPAASPGSSAPAAPTGSSPRPGPKPGPSAAAPQPQSPLPGVPAVPGVPDPPSAPAQPVELPPLPTDQLPVEAPKVPELPGVPDVSEGPGVPELPKLP